MGTTCLGQEKEIRNVFRQRYNPKFTEDHKSIRTDGYSSMLVWKTHEGGILVVARSFLLMILTMHGKFGSSKPMKTQMPGDRAIGYPINV